MLGKFLLVYKSKIWHNSSAKTEVSPGIKIYFRTKTCTTTLLAHNYTDNFIEVVPFPMPCHIYIYK